MKTRYKLVIIAMGVMIFLGWTVTEGSLSSHPTMMCYDIMGCSPIGNYDFLSCIASEVSSDGRSVMEYCGDPQLVEITERGSVKVKLPDGTMVVGGN